MKGGTSRPQPCGSRKGGELGDARQKVDDGRNLTGCGDHGTIGADRGGVDDGAGALAGEQVALGEQLVVGSDDDSTGDAEVGRQCSRRWQRRARRQPSGADRVTQPAFDLGTQAARPGTVELDQQVRRSGTHRRTGIGPYQKSTAVLRWSHDRRLLPRTWRPGAARTGLDRRLRQRRQRHGRALELLLRCPWFGAVRGHHTSPPADPAIRSRCLIEQTRHTPDVRRESASVRRRTGGTLVR